MFTTNTYGEEDPVPPTTRPFGEEDPMTTHAVGEEDGDYPYPDSSFSAFGSF